MMMRDFMLNLVPETGGLLVVVDGTGGV